MFNCIPKFVAGPLCNAVFSFMAPERGYHPVPGSTDLSTFSSDGTLVAAWGIHPQGERRRGTLFFLHGIGLHSAKPWYRERLSPIAEKSKLSLVGIDLRHHGKSGNMPPSFGTAETWDLGAVMDKAQTCGFERPFFVFGESYGGMVAQRAAMTDQRISAVICAASPAWPWDAVASALRFTRFPFSVSAGHLINACHGFNIMADGDPRVHTQPVQQPRFLYLIGDQDHHDPANTRKVWDSFYPDKRADPDKGPTEAPNQLKWFHLIKGAGHGDIINAPLLYSDMNALIDLVLSRQVS